jgi:hypothetical protein
MSNKITITACDNELIILAFQWGGSFELCRILSGNSNSVNIILNIVAGQYAGPLLLNGVHSGLISTNDIYLNKGSYSIQLLGLNWGAAGQFTVDVNGLLNTQPHSPKTTPPSGLTWHPDVIVITV